MSWPAPCGAWAGGWDELFGEQRRASKAQITSGWKSHSRSCRYDWIADGLFRWVNRRDGSLVTKSTLGGRANPQAVTCVKLEQASKQKMWMPTCPLFREGQSGPGRNPTRERVMPITEAPDRSTGVVSTACGEGNLGNRGKPGVGGGDSHVTGRVAASLGLGEGHSSDEAG